MIRSSFRNGILLGLGLLVVCTFAGQRPAADVQSAATGGGASSALSSFTSSGIGELAWGAVLVAGERQEKKKKAVATTAKDKKKAPAKASGQKDRKDKEKEKKKEKKVDRKKEKKPEKKEKDKKEKKEIRKSSNKDDYVETDDDVNDDTPRPHRSAVREDDDEEDEDVGSSQDEERVDQEEREEQEEEEDEGERISSEEQEEDGYAQPGHSLTSRLQEQRRKINTLLKHKQDLRDINLDEDLVRTTDDYDVQRLDSYLQQHG
eukprot:GHVT01024827.1.p1 GENE.GHVT01024827.1~~GHVT01024827.1.p1  ORF type:complete len:262 (-),score=93.33 GHVT01024827.1:291-1076(-)